jgi:hypothetical protein
LLQGCPLERQVEVFRRDQAQVEGVGKGKLTGKDKGEDKGEDNARGGCKEGAELAALPSKKSGKISDYLVSSHK